MLFDFIAVSFAIGLSIFLIIKQVVPIVALFIGGAVGVLLGGANLAAVLDLFITGTGNMSGVNIRVVAGGVMAGVLIGSGAMETIARSIIDNLGERRLLLAIALSAFIATAVGVFVTIGVIILAPIGLEVGKKAGLSKASVILALSGGGKAGNLISPNANTVVAAELFDVELSAVMLGGALPALAGFALTVVLASHLKMKGEGILAEDVTYTQGAGTPSQALGFKKAMAAPMAMMVLLLVGPILNLWMDAPWAIIDAMFALPLAAVMGALVMGKHRELVSYVNLGLTKVMPVVLTMMGAGVLGEMISRSAMPTAIQTGIAQMGIPSFLLAPISGALLATAAGSTVTGVILAGGAFAPALLGMGTAPLSSAVMMHAGAIISDVPHGNYVLATCDVFKIDMKQRAKVLPYETLIGFIMVVVAVVLFCFVVA